MNDASFQKLPAQMDRISLPPHEPAPSAPRNLKWFAAASVAGKPPVPRKWLVEGLIPGATVTLLSGDGGTGKSLLALQLAFAVATGTAWLGRAVTPGSALFISAEDDRDELHRRLADVARVCANHLDGLAHLSMLSLAGEDALLANLDRGTGVMHPNALYRALDDRVGADCPALVVLDTLADLFPGNENDRTQARQFVGLLRRMSIRHDCAIVLLSHPSLSGLNSGSGASGSTGWNNSVRTRLYLERIVLGGQEANPDARLLRTMKANYSRTGGEIGMTWRDGVFVADPSETNLDRQAGEAKAERVFLALLDKFTEQGRHVSANRSPAYAPTVFAKHPEVEGMSKQRLEAAMERLLARGLIEVAEHGKGAKARQHIARKGVGNKS